MFKNTKLYEKYLYKIDLYFIKKEMIAREKVKEKYKKKTITDKKEAIKFLNKQKNALNLYYAYAYALSNELKIDTTIYEMLKEKFIFNEDDLFVNYARDFVHEYGESCGESHKKDKIDGALTEIKKYISDGELLYAYWMFYSLDWKCNIPFKDYYEIYNMFKDNETIQGYLIGEFTHRGRKPRSASEYIKLLEITSDNCLKDNYYMILTRWYYDKGVYDYLLKRGVAKEKLDKGVNEYLERYEILKEKAQNNNLTREEKIDYRRYIVLYYRIIQDNKENYNDLVYEYFKDKKEMNYINEPFHPCLDKKIEDQIPVTEYSDDKNGIKGISKEEFHQLYIDNNGFNTTMNGPSNLNPAIEEFIEQGPVKKLYKKENK